MKEKITSKTTLNRIIELVHADFGVDIDRSTAKEIKNQGQKGCAVWTPNGLRTVSGIVIVRKQLK